MRRAGMATEMREGLMIRHARSISVIGIGATLLGTAAPMAWSADVRGETAQATTYQVLNGRWFTGTDFVPKTMYVVDRVLRSRKPKQIDSIIDLRGSYVVPPFGEAHTHTLLDRASRIPEFLRLGIFYANVMNASRATWERERRGFNQPGSVDVAVAIAGLTAPDGHPLQIGLRWQRDTAKLDGDWVHLIDNLSDLDRQWPSVLGSGTDLVKTFLEYADHYRDRRGNPTIASRYRGLDPALLPEIVRRAHTAKLRVATHVRTASDFRLAIGAGVDEIAHLPGFSIGELRATTDTALANEPNDLNRFRIDSASVRLAAARGVVVQTTLSGWYLAERELSPELLATFRALKVEAQRVHIDNLRLLKHHGVRIALGSDAGRGTTIDEVRYIRSLNVFSDLELLKLLSESTPKAIFPDRKIGTLGDGYEASFVSLRDNPIRDLEALQTIQLLVKQGYVLPPIKD